MMQYLAKADTHKEKVEACRSEGRFFPCCLKCVVAKGPDAPSRSVHQQSRSVTALLLWSLVKPKHFQADVSLLFQPRFIMAFKTLPIHPLVQKRYRERNGSPRASSFLAPAQGITVFRNLWNEGPLKRNGAESGQA